MSLINIPELIIKHSLEARNNNQNIDCVFFIGDDDDIEEVECYPGNTREDFFKSEKYSNYNKNVSDEDWNDFYDKCFELLPYITLEYGPIYVILCDFKTSELIITTRHQQRSLRDILFTDTIPF